MAVNKQNLEEFNLYHIELIWKVLQERFSFNVREWKFKFAEYRDKVRVQRKDLDHELTSDFYQFGNAHINPVLNQILCRNELYPTFNNLVTYIVTGKRQQPIKKKYEGRRSER